MAVMSVSLLLRLYADCMRKPSTSIKNTHMASIFVVDQLDDRYVPCVNLVMDGKKLKKMRERLGENQTEFAARLGIDQTTLSRWEAYGVPEFGPSRKVAELVLSSLEGAA